MSIQKNIQESLHFSFEELNNSTGKVINKLNAFCLYFFFFKKTSTNFFFFLPETDMIIKISFPDG